MNFDWTKRLLVFAIAACSISASAADFPLRPIKLIVPYAAGASIADIFARTLADIMSKDLGQAIVVDNKPGASGMIGAAAVAQAPADGYSLYLATNSLVLNPLLHKKVNYEPRDLKLLAIGLEVPLVMVINPRIPAKTIKEFAAYAREPGRKLNYSSVGLGNVVQLATERLKSEAQFEMTHIPYPGKSGDAIMAVMSGQTDFMITALAQALPFIQSGKLRALAVMTTERWGVLPDVPTAAESGYPNLRIATWDGIAVHASTPEGIVARLRQSIDKSLVDPAYIERFKKMGGVIVQAPRTPAEVERYLSEETKLWSEVIREQKISLD